MQEGLPDLGRLGQRSNRRHQGDDIGDGEFDFVEGLLEVPQVPGMIVLEVGSQGFAIHVRFQGIPVKGQGLLVKGDAKAGGRLAIVIVVDGENSTEHGRETRGQQLTTGEESGVHNQLITDY